MVFWFIYISYRHLTGAGISKGLHLLITHWWFLLLFVIAYTLAFYVRSVGWRMLIISASSKMAPTVGMLFRYHLAGLLVNHILPLKAGDAARVYLLHRQNDMGWKSAIQSVAYSRLLDMASLLLIAGLALYWMELSVDIEPWLGLAVVPFVIICGWAAPKLSKGIPSLTRTLFAWPWILLSWVLEGVVVWSVLQAMQVPLAFSTAAGINAVTIAGQLFHVTPGGLGTYESVMSFLLQQVGYTASLALEIALISHLLKFIYSYLAGAWSLVSLGVNREDLSYLFKRKEGRETVHEKSI